MRNQIADDVTTSATEPCSQLSWHIIGEYPPQFGGVSDYIYSVATGLAHEGDEVHVWCADCPGEQPEADGVVVHRELGRVSLKDLRRVGRELDKFAAPRKILVQWVPQAYGYRSMNVGFCCWLWNRSVRHGDTIEIMAHEPYLSFSRNWKQCLAAVAHRVMTIILLRAAQKVWMSIPEWERCLRPYALGRRLPFRWLPIPNNIHITENPRVAQLRRLYAPNDAILIGHFGTYGTPVTSLLEPILCALAEERANQTVLLMGMGSEEFRNAVVARNPGLALLVRATGVLAPAALSAHVASCDLLVQPYPDGVSSRRTSLMLGLNLGKALVSTTGPLTEPLWRQSGAIHLAPVGNTKALLDFVRQLRSDPVRRRQMGEAAFNLYKKYFDVSHTIATLRGTAMEAHNTLHHE